MSQYISIAWTYGRPAEGADTDESRAQAAAEKVLDEGQGWPNLIGRVDYLEAMAAYDRHMSDEEYYRSTRDTALISIWEAAEAAANLVLTEGWYSPAGAHCVIRAWA